ncbi:MAG: SpoIIE family protein phosphatase [Lachnospiraceae bacterium]|nr:SpoIIE family protein phosphatase [Lachnospiraceae bacterium]
MDQKLLSGQDLENNLFQENEWEANRYVARCMRVLSLVAVACWILDLLGVFIIPKIIMSISVPLFLVMALLPTLFCRYKLKWIKYAIMCCVIAGIFVLSCFISKHVIIAWTLPLILSCHYYSKKMARLVLLMSEVLFSLSIYIAMYWGEWDQLLLDAAYYSGERIITSKLLIDNTLFFVLPRALVLLGVYTVCKTIAGRTRGLLEKQARDSEEHQRISAELNVATHIQTSMLPCIFPAFPDRPEFDIYATMTPAKEVGGDFYDFFLIDDNHLAIVMADVSGKGVPAALFMMIAKSLLKSAAQSGLMPDAVLAKVNNELVENNDAEMFVTCWLGIYDFVSKKLVFANAGHNAPVVRRRGGAFEFLVFRPSFVLGEMENICYRTGEIVLNSGDEIYLYTDGVTEATNAKKQLYGNDRLLKVLNSAFLKDVSAETICRTVKADVDRFVGEAPQFDDITMLSLKLLSRDSITVVPTMDSITEVSALVEGVMEEQQIPKKIQVKMNIAVDEIFSNIIRYSKADEATVECDIRNGRIGLIFTDNGEPYNPTRKPDPDTGASADDRENGGMGIYIVKQFMDSMEYEYRGGYNILTLIKNV